VRGSNRLRSKRLPITLTLSPRNSGERNCDSSPTTQRTDCYAKLHSLVALDMSCTPGVSSMLSDFNTPSATIIE
jgi:hypothetical protein